MKKVEILLPTFLKDFKCIGSSCSDNCCDSKWRISIDRHTYNKYKSSKSKDLKSDFKEYVKRDKSKSNLNNGYAYIVHKNNRCPFLDEKKMCNIHCHLGEDALSNVCYQYPRAYRQVNNMVEQSATISCPVITRLTLSQKDGIDFYYKESTINPRRLICSTYDKSLFSSIDDCINARNFSIEIIQNRNLSLDIRLFILGCFINKLSLEKTACSKIIDSYRSLMNDVHIFNDMYAKLPTNIPMQLQVIKNMLDNRYKMVVENDESSFALYYKQYLLGLNYRENSTKEDICNTYTTAYQELYKPFIETNEYLLENFIVYSIYTYFFNSSKKTTKNIESHYNELVLKYTMIRTLLISIGNNEKKIDEELVYNLCQNFSKEIEHNEVYFNIMLDYLKKNNIITPAHMSILIKM